MTKKKMNILVVTHQEIYPVNSGGAMTSFSYIDELRKFHNVSIIIFEPFIPKEPYLSALKEKWNDVIIHTISEQVKGNKIKPFLKRALKYVGILNPIQADLSQSILFRYDYLPQYQIEAFTKIINNTTFDVIEVNYAGIFSLVHGIPEKTLKVAVNHEPKFRRTQTFVDNKLVDNTWGSYLKNYQEVIENALLQQYDATICLNEYDQQLIANKITKPVYTSPVSASWDDIATIKPENKPIETVFFLGGADHYPNYDAMVWYKESIGQHVFEQYNIKLQVIGNWPDAKREELKCDYIVFRGFVDDLNEVAENSLMLVPVRLGGGIRTKIQWAMSKGVPVISTFFGYEGIPAIHQESIIEANTPEIFIQSVGEVIANNDLRNNLRNNANLLIRKYFSPATVVASREQIYQELLRIKNS